MSQLEKIRHGANTTDIQLLELPSSPFKSSHGTQAGV